jgi:hypothetical protein
LPHGIGKRRHQTWGLCEKYWPIDIVDLEPVQNLLRPSVDLDLSIESSTAPSP